MPLPIKEVQGLPRKVRRRIWLGWWKYRKKDIEGKSRSEMRQHWRALWGLISSPNN